MAHPKTWGEDSSVECRGADNAADASGNDIRAIATTTDEVEEDAVRRAERTSLKVSKKRNKNARRGRKMSAAQRAKQEQLREQTREQTGGASRADEQPNSVQAARQQAMRGSARRHGSGRTDATGPRPGNTRADGADEVRPGLFPPSRRPPRDPNRKPWETYACMVMALMIVFLVPDWRDPENPWPAWFYVAPLAFGGLGALFALLDKRRRLALSSFGFGLVLFVGLVSVIALT